MYISDEELEARIESEDNLLNRVEIRKLHNGGRRLGHKNLPPMIRELIAIGAREDGPTKASVEFDVNRTTASRLSAGIIAHSDGQNAEFKAKIDSAIEKKTDAAHDRALDSLMTVLGVVEEKAEGIKNAKTAARVAKDLADVTAKIRPRTNPLDGSNFGPGAQVLIYAPSQKHISQYKEVDV